MWLSSLLRALGLDLAISVAGELLSDKVLTELLNVTTESAGSGLEHLHDH
jgi:hypothetical protein